MDWEYHDTSSQWVRTIGEWRAIVRRVGPGMQWSPHIERLSEPYDRYIGPTSPDPVEGRLWCLRKTVRL